MCGAIMRLKVTQAVVHVPGNPKPSTRPASEWVCPDCDYFEEDEKA